MRTIVRFRDDKMYEGAMGSTKYDGRQINVRVVTEYT